MKNRVNVLCLRDGIETVQQFAYKTGFSFEKAKAIINQEYFIDPDTMDVLCDLFNVTPRYLLCLH